MIFKNVHPLTYGVTLREALNDKLYRPEWFAPLMERAPIDVDLDASIYASNCYDREVAVIYLAEGTIWTVVDRSHGRTIWYDVEDPTDAWDLEREEYDEIARDLIAKVSYAKRRYESDRAFVFAC